MSILVAVEFAAGRFQMHDLVPVTDYGTKVGKVLSRRVNAGGLTDWQRWEAEKAANWLLGEPAARETILACGIRVSKV